MLSVDQLPLDRTSLCMYVDSKQLILAGLAISFGESAISHYEQGQQAHIRMEFPKLYSLLDMTMTLAGIFVSYNQWLLSVLSYLAV